MHYGKDMKLRNSLLINEIYHFLGVKLVWSELATEKRYPALLIPIYFLRQVQRSNVQEAKLILTFFSSCTIEKKHFRKQNLSEHPQSETQNFSGGFINKEFVGN